MSRSNEELRILAQDFVDDKIFYNPNVKDLNIDFPIMRLMSRESVDKLLAQKPVFFYEYLDQAISSVLQRPQFKTFKYLTIDEYKVFISIYKSKSRKQKRNKNDL